MFFFCPITILQESFQGIFRREIFSRKVSRNSCLNSLKDASESSSKALTDTYKQSEFPCLGPSNVIVLYSPEIKTTFV